MYPGSHHKLPFKTCHLIPYANGVPVLRIRQGKSDSYERGMAMGSSLKWTVLGQSGRSEGVKVDGHVRNWTVQKGLKWTACESEQSLNPKVDGPEGSN